MLHSLRLLTILLLMQLLLPPRADATGVLWITGSASNNHAAMAPMFTDSAAKGPILDSVQNLNGAPPDPGSEIETVFATADYGTLGVSAGGKVVGPATVGSLGAGGNASAEFSDVFTVTAAGLTGTTGTITAAFGLAAFVVVDGGGGCDGSAQVSYGVSANVTGGGFGFSTHSGT
ncbi:MAG TPA: hypothetical protein VMS55_19895 [Myxococcota bacterium]|nr:hypothetical protein [Myxococcota bacterium]